MQTDRMFVLVYLEGQKKKIIETCSRCSKRCDTQNGKVKKVTSTYEALTETKTGFYAVAGFSRVIRAVDCTRANC